MHSKKPIIKAKYQETDFGSTVHGKTIKPNQGLLFIMNVLKGVVNWKEFDSETMSAGSPILWDKASITRLSIKTNIEKLATESKTLTPRPQWKQWSQPEKWIQSLRKKVVNSGKEYEYKVKKKSGEKITKKVKAKQIKPSCNDICKLKCKESFSEEIRLQIFNKFWASGDKALQS